MNNKDDYIKIVVENRFKKYIFSIVMLMIFTSIFISINYWTPIIEPNSSFAKIILQILIFYFFLKIFYIRESNSDDEPTLRLASQILIYAMAIVYLSPQIVYLISLIFIINPNYILSIGTLGDWLGFAGSIIGGSLTLFAVIFAFILDKKQRESDVDLRSIPKIVIDWYFGKNSKDNSLIKRSLVSVYHLNKNEIILNMKLHLINDSTYLASKLEFIESRILFFRNVDNALIDNELPIDVINFTEKHIVESNLTSFLFNSSEFILNLPIRFPEKYINHVNNNIENYLARLILKVKYRSAIGIRDIILTSEVNFHISYPTTLIDSEKPLLLISIENIRNDYLIKNKQRGK